MTRIGAPINPTPFLADFEHLPLSGPAAAIDGTNITLTYAALAPTDDDFALLASSRPATKPSPSLGKSASATPSKPTSGKQPEVVIADAPLSCPVGDLRKAWKVRQNRRQVPLVLVFPSIPRDGKPQVILVTNPRLDSNDPTKEAEPAVWAPMPIQDAERLCAAILIEPNGEYALRRIRDNLAMAVEDPDAIPGLRNEGLFSTHLLRRDLPTIKEWQVQWSTATTLAPSVSNLKGTKLFEALKYKPELDGAGPFLKLNAGEATAAIGLELDPAESFDHPSQRFGARSPARAALDRAAKLDTKYAILNRGKISRLYGRGISGLTGRGEGFLELAADQLRPEHRAYLPMLMSADALGPGGHLARVHEGSERYATALGQKLKERIYIKVVPELAKSLAKQWGIEKPTLDDLNTMYHASLVLLFRLVFLAYAEDRDFLPYRHNEAYRKNSLKVLANELFRLKATKQENFGNKADYYDQILLLFKAVDEGSDRYGVPAYNGGLFSTKTEIGKKLLEIRLPDREFAPVLGDLLIFSPDQDSEPAPVDFRDLDVREFGTIYEGLLESGLNCAETDLTTDKDLKYVPITVAKKGKAPEVVVAKGHYYVANRSGERKAGGSYYTPEFAVSHLLDQALEPALTDHLNRLKDMKDADAAAALFDFRVADISMGSGHFLVGAVDRIAARYQEWLADRQLAPVTQRMDSLRKTATDALTQANATGEISDIQLLRRMVARHCIYGVDINPTAVELARLAVWVHTFVPGLPLSFLDHNLRHGNSIAGIGTLSEAEDAFRKAESGRSSISQQFRDELKRVRPMIEAMAAINDATVADVDASQRKQTEIDEELKPLKAIFNVLTAARVDKSIADWARKRNLSVALLKGAKDFAGTEQGGRAAEILKAANPLHFPLAFPEIFGFEDRGFDVIVGNPPWEKTQASVKEFWARHSPGLRALKKGARTKEEKRLASKRSDLAKAFESEKATAALNAKLLTRGPYPGVGKAHPDLYVAFCWRFLRLCTARASIGVVVPEPAWTGDSSSLWRASVFGESNLVRITVLVNRKRWVFSGVDERNPRVALSTIHVGPPPSRNGPALFGSPTDWTANGGSKKGTAKGHNTPLRQNGVTKLYGPFHDKEGLSASRALSPVCVAYSQLREWMPSMAVPGLPSLISFDTFKVLRRQRSLSDATTSEWSVRFNQELNGTTDASTKEEELAFDPDSTDIDEHHCPVYSGETFDHWQADRGVKHYYGRARWTQVEAYLQSKRLAGIKRRDGPWSAFDHQILQDVTTLPATRARILFRDVGNRTSNRSLIAALVPPRVVAVHKAPQVLLVKGDTQDESFLLGFLSSMALDWYVRRYVQITLSFGLMKALPIPRPPRTSKLWQRVVTVSGRLATSGYTAPDGRRSKGGKTSSGQSGYTLDGEFKSELAGRFEEWASKASLANPASLSRSKGAGVSPVVLGPEAITPHSIQSLDEMNELIFELDGLACALYGLEEHHIRHIYETFHEGANYSARCEAVLGYWRKWKGA